MNVIGLFTHATCGDACWHAREEICRCSCGGLNHGILNNKGASQPDRTCRIDGLFYELAAVIPGPAENECAMHAFRRTESEVSRLLDERFPGVDTWAYGPYRQASTRPVIDRKISATQMKWPEVQAVPNAYRLVWALPVGSPYLVRGENHQAVWKNVS